MRLLPRERYVLPPGLDTRARLGSVHPMASSSEMVQRFEREGLFLASPTLTDRRMRERARKLVAAQSRGGGKDSPQVELRHLTNFLLGNAAHLPTGAAEAVRVLRGLKMTGYEVWGQKTPADALQIPHPAVMDLAHINHRTLGENLDTLVSSMGNSAARESMREVSGFDWTLTLSADPPFASISLKTWSEFRIAKFGDKPVGGRSKRLAEISFDALLVAGELWQDTLERKKSAPPAQTKDAALPGAAPPVKLATTGKKPARSNQDPNRIGSISGTAGTSTASGD